MLLLYYIIFIFIFYFILFFSFSFFFSSSLFSLPLFSHPTHSAYSLPPPPSNFFFPFLLLFFLLTFSSSKLTPTPKKETHGRCPPEGHHFPPFLCLLLLDFLCFFSLSFLFIYFSPLKSIFPFPLPFLCEHTHTHTHTSPSTVTIVTVSDVMRAPLLVTPSPTTSSHSFSFYLSFLSTPTLIPSTFILVASKMVSNHFLLPFDFYSTFFGDLGFCLLGFGWCLRALRILGLHGC